MLYKLTKRLEINNKLQVYYYFYVCNIKVYTFILHRVPPCIRTLL